MTTVAMILARLAYDDMIREIREKNPDYFAPAFESIIQNEDVIQHTEECADKVREYLESQYTI